MAPFYSDSFFASTYNQLHLCLSLPIYYYFDRNKTASQLICYWLTDDLENMLLCLGGYACQLADLSLRASISFYSTSASVSSSCIYLTLSSAFCRLIVSMTLVQNYKSCLWNRKMSQSRCMLLSFCSVFGSYWLPINSLSFYSIVDYSPSLSPLWLISNKCIID